MASSSSHPILEEEEGKEDDRVVLILTDPSTAAPVEYLIEDGDGDLDEKIAQVSSADIDDWDLPLLLHSRVLRVEVTRSRLVQHSSYFRGLLQGSFSESILTNVPLQWNLESALSVLRSVFGCPLDVTSANFLHLLEAALFFGVEALLLECEAWLSKVTSLKGKSTLHLPVDMVIEIWNFGIEHGIHFILELCSGYVARNFVQVISSSCFVSIPYKMLCSCVEHPYLTVDSEKQLCQALLVWCASNVKESDVFRCLEKDHARILRKVRVGLLPLAYAAGLRKNKYFSMIVDECVYAALCLVKDEAGVLFSSRDDGLKNFRIRLTNDSEKIELGGCTQFNVVHLLLSLLPSNMETTLKKGEMQAMVELNNCRRDYRKIMQKFSLLSFAGIYYVDLSKCPKFHVGIAVKLLHSAFPSLRVLKLSHCSDFKVEYIYSLTQTFPLLDEADFRVDISPIVFNQASVLSVMIEECHCPCADPYWTSKAISSPSNITKLTLEGRTDLRDLDLHIISKLMGSLSYVNLKGCNLLTDMGIAELILQCSNLHSIFVSYTSFGTKSVSSLCSDSTSVSFPEVPLNHQVSSSIASRVLQLHADACKGIDSAAMKLLVSHACMLRSLSLSATCLVEDSLYDFKGISLEELDVSETMVSLESLVSLMQKNTGLKSLKVNGCRNLYSLVRGTSELIHLDYKDLCQRSSKGCPLEEVACGWGFSFFFMQKMNTCLRNVRNFTISIGASLDQQMLLELPRYCPLLESVVLKFQVISDSIIKGLLKLNYLKMLAICYCIGDLTSQALSVHAVGLKKLSLQWVCPWMTNGDLVILSGNCPCLAGLSLSGCKLLDSESQRIISSGWPGLTCIHLEECGCVTTGQDFSIFNCKALEDLLLRHSGQGIRRNFIGCAASQLPLLRKLALDLCDACEGGFDSPSHVGRFFLSTVTIARCKSQRCSFDLQRLGTFRPMHQETIVLEWNSKQQRTTIIKERL